MEASNEPFCLVVRLFFFHHEIQLFLAKDVDYYCFFDLYLQFFFAGFVNQFCSHQFSLQWLKKPEAKVWAEFVFVELFVLVDIGAGQFKFVEALLHEGLSLKLTWHVPKSE